MKQAQATVESAPVEIVSEETRAALAVRAPQESPQVPALADKVTAAPITPAQAKVNAIADLTMKAYERAGTLVLTQDEITRLQAEFPDEAFKPGAAGKEHLLYIEHAFLRDRLNQVIGPMQWAIVPRSRWAEPFSRIGTNGKLVEGSRVYVEAMLVIRGAFAGEAIGTMEYYPKNAGQDYSDAVEGAKTAALRRCCKEIGIGLQAWKKDWCDGWWKRNPTGKVGVTQQQQRQPGPTPMRQAQQQKVQATQQTKTTAPKSACATNATLDWFLKQCQGAEEQTENYLREISWLMPNEKLAQLELRFVPTSREEFNILKDRVIEFTRGEQARKPYEPHAEPLQEKPKTAPAKQTITTKPAPEKEPAEKPPKHAEDWFWDQICPIPHAGQKRDEYLENPDTIGSLYDAGCQGDEKAARRLFGFLNHFEPKGWEKRDGTKMPPSEADIKFREALDAFGEWHEKHKDEQREEPPQDDLPM